MTLQSFFYFDLVNDNLISDELYRELDMEEFYNEEEDYEDECIKLFDRFLSIKKGGGIQ